MTVTNLLQKAQKFEIQVYKKPRDLKALRENNVPFSGSPLKHPDNPEKILIVGDPYSTSPFYYEFKIEDIAYMEELPNLVSLDGESITMARIWVKKRSMGVRCVPFLVEEIRFI